MVATASRPWPGHVPNRQPHPPIRQRHNGIPVAANVRGRLCRLVARPRRCEALLEGVCGSKSAGASARVARAKVTSMATPVVPVDDRVGVDHDHAATFDRVERSVRPSRSMDQDVGPGVRERLLDTRCRSRSSDGARRPVSECAAESAGREAVASPPRRVSQVVGPGSHVPRPTPQAGGLDRQSKPPRSARTDVVRVTRSVQLASDLMSLGAHVRLPTVPPRLDRTGQMGEERTSASVDSPNTAWWAGVPSRGDR